MAVSPNHCLLFSSSSIFMAILFAYSASVQFNDPDWYFWLPLYASAAAVNILQTTTFKSKNIIEKVVKVVLPGGVALFVKVVMEAHLFGLAGFWSLDMRERAVREKVGSGLVAASMYLHSKAFEASEGSKRRVINSHGKFVAFGMAALVLLSYGFSLYFFAFIQDDMRF